MNKALFLDRDGIINVDKGYVYRFDELLWIEEIFEIMKLAMERGYKIIVLTNQAGVHRKMYTDADVVLLHQQMGDFLAQKGLLVTDWFYCPYLDHECRKPRPGMLIEARDKYQIDLGASFMIGDKMSDIFETDGSFVRPFTYLIRGRYELLPVAERERVAILESHGEAIVELGKVL